MLLRLLLVGVLAFTAFNDAAMGFVQQGPGQQELPAPQACPEVDDGPSPLPADLPSPKTAAVGTMDGVFSVSSTGQAHYSIPLRLPSIRANMPLHLGVVVDSAASGEGVLGHGASLTGFSSVVMRCPKTLTHDIDVRSVRHDAGDAFCIDDKRLVAVNPQSARPEFFRTFPDTFSNIHADYAEAEGWDPERGPKRFRVKTRAGLILDYGYTESGRVLAPKAVVRSWLLTRMSDRNENTVEFSYRNEKHPAEGYTVEHAPERIDYTGHPSAPASRAVVFEYGTREKPDTRILYARGMALRRSWRLDAIRMLGPGDAEVHSYHFDYALAPTTKRMLLQQMTLCVADGTCQPPTRFTWHHGPGAQFVELPTSIKAPESALASVMLTDASGDGLDDLVVADVDMTGGSEQPLTNWRVAPNLSAEVTSVFFNASTLALQEKHYDPPSPIQPDRGTPLDYNHDGRMDVFLHDIHGQFTTWRVLLAKPDQSFTMLDTKVPRPYPFGFAPPLSLATWDASAHLLDATGDGMSDLLQCAFNGVDYAWGVHPWKPQGVGFEASGQPIAELSAHVCNTDVHTVDLDGDGKVELLVPEVTVTGNGAIVGTTFHALTYQRTSLKWEKRTTGLPLAPLGGRLLLLDVNGDGLPDGVQTGFGDRQLRTFLNTGKGFSAAHASLQAPVLDADLFAKLAAPIDFNADGKQDLLMPMPGQGGTPAWRILQATGNDGDGTFTLVDPGLPFEAQVLDADVTLADPHGPRVTDVDGDSIQDVLLNLQGYFHVFKNSLKDEDLLASVTDGLHARDPGEPGFTPNVQITYGHLIDLAATTGAFAMVPPEARTYLSRDEDAEDEACAYPVRCVVGPRHVVSGYTIQSGGAKPREFEVAYRNGRYHRLGQGFLGFGARIVRDKDTGAGTAEFYDNVTFDAARKTFPFVGHVVHEWKWNPVGSSRVDLQACKLEYSIVSPK